MSQYVFVTAWQVGAPIERVWHAISRAEDWPSWWKGVLAVDRRRQGDSSGIGEVTHQVWKSRLPYRLVFDYEIEKVEPPTLLQGRAVGELEGTGTWRLAEEDDVTRVSFDWHVQTTRRWMDLPIPFARRVFQYNHDVVMRWGSEGLAQLLGAPVVVVDTRAATPVAAPSS
jgi:uncharacterized protein YndB with AHSA1/START domain